MKNITGISQKVKSTINKIKRFVTKNAVKLSVAFGVIITSPAVQVFANGGGAAAGADGWSTVSEIFTTWLPRLGGVIILLGVIEFGMSFMKDNPEGKTLGVRMMISGAVIAGAVTLISKLLV